MPAPMATAGGSSKRKRKQKGKSTVPLLPPEADDVEVSEEDIQFVKKHKRYAGFLANLDSKKITKQVLGLKPDQDEDLETFYEKRAESRTSAGLGRKSDDTGHLSVDPVDALPVKSLEGELHYRTKDHKTSGETYVSVEDRRAFIRRSKGLEAHRDKAEDELPRDNAEMPMDTEEGPQNSNKGRTKAERRNDKKLSRKRDKEEKELKDSLGPLPTMPPSTDERLEELDSYISVQEKRAQMKARMAEIGTELLANPEENLPALKELQDMCADRDDTIAQLAMLSSMAVFKDLVPGYRIRVPTQKELEMAVSKEVKKQRDYETTFLRYYQAYVQMLVRSAKIRTRRKTALRCMCKLLDAVSHFNYRESLLRAIIPRMNSDDPDYRSMSCEAIRMVFENEAKHGGQATLEAVQLIADFVKLHNCCAYPDVVEVFLALTFNEDLQKPPGDTDKKTPRKTFKQQLKESKRKKKELAEKLKKEVETDFKEAMTGPDVAEQRKLQTMTLSAVFETYFRVLKTSLEPAIRRNSLGSSGNNISKRDGLGLRPLLVPCLGGLAKFSHLISIDFMADLLAALRRLSCGEVLPKGHVEDVSELALTPSERLQCCIIAFKIVRSNMDALNIDLREFYVQLFNLLYELSACRSDGINAEVLAQALQVMLWEGRQHDMQRTAAFVKRLATVSLHVDLPEAMAALVTARHLLHRNKKCRNILENDGGGGAVGGTVAMFQLDATDPDLSGALSSVLWEATLLQRHYHPSLSELASEVSLLSSSTQSTLLATMSPTEAVEAYSTSAGGFRPGIQPPPKVTRRKVYRIIDHTVPPFLAEGSTDSSVPTSGAYEEGERSEKIFSSYFRVLRNHQDNDNLRRELGRLERSLGVWNEYKATKQRGNDNKVRSVRAGRKACRM